VKNQKKYPFPQISITVFIISAVIGALFLSNTAANAGQAYKFSIALIGDMPYDSKGQAQTPAVISAINGNSLINFSLFDGDTMSGKGDKCDDANYSRIKSDFFDKFSKPIFYSVGDNEWVDCDRAVKGSYDPNNRLALVRSTYFQNASGSYISLGGSNSRINVIHDANYPELQMFSYKGITFIIPNVPGSANNSPVATPTFKMLQILHGSIRALKRLMPMAQSV